MRVEGKLVVVTGAGSGIGAAMARRFAVEGANAVVVADLHLHAAHAVAAECTSCDGSRVSHARAIDVADAAALRALIERVEAELGPIGLFCSKAGLGVRSGEPVTAKVWQRLWDVHVQAHVTAAGCCAPRRRPGC
jgi:NAD(P)-dependent dehydrogenase (short-subunit alcohol dehydrogenase family)